MSERKTTTSKGTHIETKILLASTINEQSSDSSSMGSNSYDFDSEEEVGVPVGEVAQSNSLNESTYSHMS
jgi:hypothetical protein